MVEQDNKQDPSNIDLPVGEVQEKTTQENEKSYTQAELDEIIKEKDEKTKMKCLELQAKYLFKENKLDDKIIPYLKFTDEESLNEVFKIIKENYKGEGKEIQLRNAHAVGIGGRVDNIDNYYNPQEMAIRKSMGLK